MLSTAPFTSNGEAPFTNNVDLILLIRYNMTMKDTFEKHYPTEHVGHWKHLKTGMDQYVVLEDREVKLINMCIRIVESGGDSLDWYRQLYSSLLDRTGLALDPIAGEFELKDLIGYDWNWNNKGKYNEEK